MASYNLKPETHYLIGSNMYSTLAAAKKKAKEYANSDGYPVTITVEKMTFRHGFMRREVKDIKTRDIIVKPTKHKNPTALVKGFIPVQVVEGQLVGRVTNPSQKRAFKRLVEKFVGH